MNDGIVSNLLDALMVLGPNIGFIAQIKKFHDVNSSEGFSKHVTLILLIANILRIFFWYGKQFNIILLFQSIASLIMQLILLQQCLAFSNNNSDSKQSNNIKANLNEINRIFYFKKGELFRVKDFWNWSQFIDYIYFLTIFVVVLIFTAKLFTFENAAFVEILGTASALVEACLGVPQVYNNFKNKSTDTLSLIMIFTWVLGDSFKSFYFYKTEAPLQLLMVGLTQLLIDFVIIAQIYYYNNIYPKLNKTKKGENISIHSSPKSTEENQKFIELDNNNSNLKNNDCKEESKIY